MDSQAIIESDSSVLAVLTKCLRHVAFRSLRCNLLQRLVLRLASEPLLSLRLCPSLWRRNNPMRVQQHSDCMPIPCRGKEPCPGNDIVMTRCSTLSAHHRSATAAQERTAYRTVTQNRCLNQTKDKSDGYAPPHGNTPTGHMRGPNFTVKTRHQVDPGCGTAMKAPQNTQMLQKPQQLAVMAVSGGAESPRVSWCDTCQSADSCRT